MKRGQSDIGGDAGTCLGGVLGMFLGAMLGLAVCMKFVVDRAVRNDGAVHANQALLHRFGRLQSDERRRRLIGLSRHARTPRQLVYQWDPATGGFTTVGDPFAERFRDNWGLVRTILAGRTAAATHHELLMDWPADREKPAASVLYDWLNRATMERLVERQGTGTKFDPYRYRLPGAGDGESG
jgi:hypothetical protein